ncbi:MAG: hypothetical protein IJ603_08685 [Bacteroidales bacterium]|nr:hypothetical protein [Bacteroidales bacterium]
MKANYTYLSDGTKTKALNASGAGYDYAGSFTYSHASNGSKTLESVAFGGGRIRRTGNNAYAVDYHISDHLGSVRAIVNASGTVVEQNDYYPFGMRHPNGLTQLAANRWRFSGKEEQDAAFGIAYSDFGARFYDRSAAWTAIDPMAENHYDISSYSYCGGNPIGLIDPTGNSWYSINTEGSIVLVDDREGKDENYDVLFTQTKDGKLNPRGALRVNNQQILSKLADHSETGLLSNYSDLLKVFYFVSDNSNVEWGLYSSSKGNVLRTDHGHISVSELTSLSGSIIAKIHSHPNTEPNTKSEHDSMGVWLSKDNYDSSGYLIPGKKLIKENETGDWLNYINEYILFGEKAAVSRVYFPKSRRVYQINYNRLPSILMER